MNDTEKQQRDTKQRRLVYDEVMKRCDHPTADDIYMKVREEDSKVSKGTVYRNLNLLSDTDKILKVKVPNAPDRFDSRQDLHCHIICTVCGSVIDSPLCYDSETDCSVAEQTGFVITRHRTVFEGICPECQAKK